MTPLYDVAIIGGGINGCACAADAALRGLSVVLLEQGDIASETSSSSTKLIHGGLRYLEHYEFSMVKKSLDERQRLLNIAPHLIVPQALVLPLQQDMRPAWMLRAGLFLYDHLSRKNALMHSQTITKPHPLLESLQSACSKGFIFYDAKTDDARLTLENALQARNHGADIYTYAQFQQAKAQDNIWYLDFITEVGITRNIQARSIINTSGASVNKVSLRMDIPIKQEITLVKGSHIVVPSLFEGEHGYLLQHEDKRIIFVLPYHGYTMVGTTDILWNDAFEKPVITTEEIHYLLALINQIFKKQTALDEVVYSWSGLRTLLSHDEKNISALSRDYVIHIAKDPALSVTVYGGKLTTYRILAEEILDKLAPLLGNKKSGVTEHTALPGADLECHKSLIMYKKQMQAHYRWLDTAILSRYLETYGTRTSLLLEHASCMEDLGIDFGHGLFETEVSFLIKTEWARCCDDILWRRTKLGLNFTLQEIERLQVWLDDCNRSFNGVTLSASCHPEHSEGSPECGIMPASGDLSLRSR